MPSKKRHQPMMLSKLCQSNKKIDGCYSNIAGLALSKIGVMAIAYKALLKLLNLWKDAGASFTPESLNYALGDDSDRIHHTLL